MTRTRETMVIVVLCLGNLFLTGMGMGLPVFTIFWGVAAGLAAILTTMREDLAALVKKPGSTPASWRGSPLSPRSR